MSHNYCNVKFSTVYDNRGFDPFCSLGMDYLNFYHDM